MIFNQAQTRRGGSELKMGNESDAARALREHPAANVVLENDRFLNRVLTRVVIGNARGAAMVLVMAAAFGSNVGVAPRLAEQRDAGTTAECQHDGQYGCSKHDHTQFGSSKTAAIRTGNRSSKIMSSLFALERHRRDLGRFRQTATIQTRISAQAPKSSPASNTAVPRTPHGRPNLQGTWAFATITPLQRPEEHKGRERLTPDEVATLEQHAVATQFVDTPPPKGQTGHYNMLWLDAGTRVISTYRTSLIVDPPDGRMPPLTPAGLERQKRQDVIQDEAARPEDLTPWDRCILGYNDPTIWTRPWSVSQTMWRTDQAVYEYACHEGNHAMRGILAGAREMERQKAAASGSTKPQ